MSIIDADPASKVDEAPRVYALHKYVPSLCYITKSLQCIIYSFLCKAR